MSRGELEEIDSSYSNVKKKPIKLLKHKNSNLKLGINDSKKNVVGQTIKLTCDHKCKKNNSECSSHPSDLNSDAIPIASNSFVGESETTGYTKAELLHKEVQRKRIQKQIESRASLTHRQRVSKFNEKLSMLPEHFDIPKVGPG
ncbi:uncharacterized protein cubi_00521 [Cryptosporidium ubiquitum]|uniref:Uncharacterized protein n=1 Tax=Cryptosporidium ubiquitum TaxID=857276 RepID=A0A1J4MBW4_9CRYT|nr:uncharacterized protein cubi_00521 [Cryptosporidium ubiquitum]OII71714.1 hypothetical protein cubi_00521 [Cryptosporidium ubiquitum]